MNKWIEHCNKIRKEHPKLSFKEVLVLAKQTYIKQSDKEVANNG